jgi:predicted enzyme related to lactoylglutathione lyase
MSDVCGTTRASRGRDEPRFEYAAADVCRAAAFYAKAFGPHAGANFLPVTGASDLRGDGEAPPRIAVEDVDDALARVWSSGGEIVETPSLDPETGEWVATFRDPAGNVLGLSQRGPRRGAVGPED